MKKKVNILLIIVLTLVCVSMVNFQVNAAVKKPAKVNSLSVERVSKNCVHLKWAKAGKANGYEIYMKTNSGKFKKIKTLKSKQYKKSGLKIGNSYCFKIRAYKKSKCKKYYGKFSSVKKINMKSYVYLVDVMSPYSKYADWAYTEYKDAQVLEMGGNKYYHGFDLATNYGDSAYAIYNLNGKYSTIEFVVGNTGTGDKDLVVSCDDEVTNVLTIKQNSLPKLYTINVKDTYKFELRYVREYWTGTLRFGNVKLYY